MSSVAIPSKEIIDQFVGNAHGNFTLVKDSLEKFPTLINTTATWNETAIQAATQTGQVDIVNYLLEHGAENDICTAAMLGNFDSVQEYLEKDHILIDARGAHGIPLLYFPVIHAHQHIADFLLQHGADPNAASPGGITPLYGAAMFNQSLLAHWLLEHGADPNPRYNGKTPLTIALGKNH
ncbi:MAG: hypothetical protein A2Y88_02475 [Chloroflexi bacterium RBG_13_48_10]|nr:MAG: hypothetical protein A2Y88_02475 [Chloroflexi bacterium RBG_13_48_10]